MTDAGLATNAQFRVASASIFLGTVVGIVLLIGVLLSFDLFLAGVERRASAARATAEYRSGVSALNAGRPSEAADYFGTAVAIDRANIDYSLALGDALLQEGRAADAEATLRALLERAENDGVAEPFHCPG